MGEPLATTGGAALGARHAAAGLLLAAAAMAAVFLVAQRGRARGRPAPAAATAPEPFYEGQDAAVREAARAVSSDPAIGALLSNDGLVRRFTQAVTDLGDGTAPTGTLSFLAPRQPFRVKRDGARTVIDARSYARYDALADVVRSLDAAACARAFRRLEPLFEACYRDLGHPHGGFRFALARAAARVRAVPVPEGELEVVPRVHMAVANAGLPESAALVYELADPRLEALSPAQKLLLRIGPRNARIVQSITDEVARALDLPLDPAAAGRQP